MRTCVRVNSPCGCGLLLRLGRAARPAAAARAADDGRDLGGDGGQLRGARVRHPQRDARDRGAAAVSRTWSRSSRARTPTPRRARRCSRCSRRRRRRSSRRGRGGVPRRAAALGARLRAAVRREVGLPITVGVASTKIAAKMASRAAKPDGLRIVGRRARVPARPPRRAAVGHRQGDRGAPARARDRDRRRGRRAVASRSWSRCSAPATAAACTRSSTTATASRSTPPAPAARSAPRARSRRGDHPPTVLEQSAARVAERLRAAGVAGRTVTLHLRFDDHTTATRSRTLPAAVDDATVIGATAAALVDTPRRSPASASASATSRRRPIRVVALIECAPCRARCRVVL